MVEFHLRMIIILDVNLPIIMDVVACPLQIFIDGELPHRPCQVQLFLQSSYEKVKARLML